MTHVFTPVTRRVVKMEAQIGDIVKKGDPLVTIQSPDIGVASSDLGKAQADLVAAEHDVYEVDLARVKVGAQAQKPLAIVIGGSLMLAFLTRILQPPLLVVAHRWLGRHTNHPGPEKPLVTSDAADVGAG